jgi:hypothetical protein
MSNQIGIVTKVAIVGLAIALLYIINAQGDIRASEDKAIDLSRVRMETLGEAMKFYSSRNKRFTANFDSLLYCVQNDSVLNRKHTLVILSNELIDALDDLKSTHLLTDMITFRKSQFEIYNILDEINDEYKSVPEIAAKNIAIYERLKNFISSPKYPNMIKAFNAADTLNFMSIEIGDYPLQVSVNKTIDFIDQFNALLPQAEIKDMLVEWASIEASLYELEKLMIDPSQKKQNKTNRYLKHTEIARRHLNSLNQLNISEQLKLITQKKENIIELKTKFTTDYFVLTQSNGRKGLENDEALLVQMDENTIIAPPTERENALRFKIEVTNNGFGYIVSCPNDEGEFSRGIFSQRFKNYGNVQNGSKSWENNN